MITLWYPEIKAPSLYAPVNGTPGKILIESMGEESKKYQIPGRCY